MKNRYIHMITFRLQNKDYMQTTFKTKDLIPTVKEYNSFVGKLFKKGDNWVIISNLTLELSS